MKLLAQIRKILFYPRSLNLGSIEKLISVVLRGTSGFVSGKVEYLFLIFPVVIRAYDANLFRAVNYHIYSFKQQEFGAMGFSSLTQGLCFS